MLCGIGKEQIAFTATGGCGSRSVQAWRLLLPLFFLGLLAGCAKPIASSDNSGHSDQRHPAAEHDHENEHEHSHEHAHHHDPEHKPADFPQAVERLRAFHAQHAAGQQPSAGQRQIISDILGWLPELAAQSELREADWNEVDRGATAIANWLDRESFTSSAWEEYARELAGLERGVSAYRGAEAEFKRRLGGSEESQKSSAPEGGE